MAAEAQRRLEPALSEEVRGRQPASCHGKFHCIWLSGECKIRIGTGGGPFYEGISLIAAMTHAKGSRQPIINLSFRAVDS
jgi:hypothetical protein